MGLFDKLNGVIKESGLSDKLREAIGAKKSEPANPLADLTVKKYFDILWGMRYTFSVIPKEVDEDNKSYVEYFSNEPCDEEKLKKAIELFNLSIVDYPSTEVEQNLKRYRKSLDSKPYQLEKEEARKIFHPKEVEKAKEEFYQVLEIIKDNIQVEHFYEGLRNMPHKEYNTPNTFINESFCEGNPIVEELVISYLIDLYKTKMSDPPEYKMWLHGYPIPQYVFIDDLSQVVIRAIHFEKNGENPKDYVTATEDEYRDFVLNVDLYKEIIDDHPFEKDKYIDKFIERIKENRVFEDKTKTSFHPLDDYYCDKACYLMWKKIAKSKMWLGKEKEDITDSNKANDVFTIIYAYLHLLNT